MRDTLFAVTHTKKMHAHVIGNVTTKLMISGGESRSVGEGGRRHGERRKRERRSVHHHWHQRGEEVLCEREFCPSVSLCVSFCV